MIKGGKKNFQLISHKKCALFSTSKNRIISCLRKFTLSRQLTTYSVTSNIYIITIFSRNLDHISFTRLGLLYHNIDSS